jgi:hypothetical protein
MTTEQEQAAAAAAEKVESDRIAAAAAADKARVEAERVEADRIAVLEAAKVAEAAAQAQAKTDEAARIEKDRLAAEATEATKAEVERVAAQGEKNRLQATMPIVDPQRANEPFDRPSQAPAQIETTSASEAEQNRLQATQGQVETPSAETEADAAKRVERQRLADEETKAAQEANPALLPAAEGSLLAMLEGMDDKTGAMHQIHIRLGEMRPFINEAIAGCDARAEAARIAAEAKPTGAIVINGQTGEAERLEAERLAPGSLATQAEVDRVATQGERDRLQATDDRTGAMRPAGFEGDLKTALETLRGFLF